jgi:endonuclease/exonuclease/phosphatase (EEP) superfamily protein YafD
MLADGRLHDAAAGRGWQATWPTFLPPLGIRIDHALVSGGIRVNSFQRGRLQGSDHRPIVVDLLLPAQRLDAPRVTAPVQSFPGRTA